MTTATETTYDLRKFRGLLDRCDEMNAVLRSATADYQHFREERVRLQGRADENRATNPRKKRRLLEDGSVVVEEEVLAAGDAKLLKLATTGAKEAHDRVERLRKETDPHRRLVARCEELLREAGVDLRVLPPPAPRTAPVGPVPTSDDLEELRGQIRELQGERKRIERAPLSEAEVHATIDAQLEEAVEALNRTPTAGLLRGNPVGFFHIVAMGEPETFSAQENWKKALGLAVLAGGDRVKKYLRARVAADAQAAGGFGLGREERKAKLAELDAQLFDLELEEERAVCDMEAAGLAISRRADADPRAVLAVR